METKHKNLKYLQVSEVVMFFVFVVDQIYHLACPASPPHYMYNPIKTIKTSSIGTLNMLGLARRVKARLLLASTSEVYGGKCFLLYDALSAIMDFPYVVLVYSLPVVPVMCL